MTLLRLLAQDAIKSLMWLTWLVQVAELFGVSVNDLLTDPNSLPAQTGVVVGKMEKAVEKASKPKKKTLQATSDENGTLIFSVPQTENSTDLIIIEMN